MSSLHTWPIARCRARAAALSNTRRPTSAHPSGRDKVRAAIAQATQEEAKVEEEELADSEDLNDMTAEVCACRVWTSTTALAHHGRACTGRGRPACSALVRAPCFGQ